MPLSVAADRLTSPSMHRERLSASRDSEAGVRIALINNMPDPALEDTELQFFELLGHAAGEFPVSVTLYSLPGVVRGERGEQRLRSLYYGIDHLWNSRVDAIIITGTEPHQADLREEPYWGMLSQVLDWAAESTVSVISSCLAAHAGVLYFDSIGRRPLSEKRCGVYDCEWVSDHVLTNGFSDALKFPHSRWNEVREQDLRASGYAILTKSARAGVDLFAKRKGNSLFVGLQGHPEYGARTLLKEYRRDVRRFLNRERNTYPFMPYGYFDEGSTSLLAEFQEKALLDPRKEWMGSFPEAAVASRLERTWHSSAVCLYRNWLDYVRTRKAEIPSLVAVSRAMHDPSRRPAVLA